MNGVYMYQCIHVHMYFCYGDKEFIMQSTLFLGGLGVCSSRKVLNLDSLRLLLHGAPAKMLLHVEINLF